MSINLPANWNSLPGPQDITRTELPNGIVLLVRVNPISPSVVVSGYLPCGSQFDPPEQLGLAHYTALMLMRGTRQRDFQQIYDALESAGASLSFGASVHNVGFGGRALAEDLPLLLDLLSQALRQPAFPTRHIERLRAQFITSLSIRAHDTASMASLQFDRLLFGDHPYGLPEDGYPETIERIQRKDLKAFHARHYGPRGMVIVVVGAVDPAEVLDQVSHALGDWSNPAQTLPVDLPQVAAMPQAARQHIVIAGKSQTDLVMGTIGPPRASADYLAASLGNSVLGQFGMMGRIGDVVREREGLAYYATTSLNGWIASGSWEVAAGVNPANLQRAIDLILDELRRFVREPVTAEELEDSQTNFIGRLPLSLESNGGVANALLNLERFQLGLDYYRHFHEIVMSATPAQVLETARRYWDPDRLVVTSAGPALE